MCLSQNLKITQQKSHNFGTQSTQCHIDPLKILHIDLRMQTK